MPILRWFWHLKLRWRIPIALVLLLVTAAAVYLLAAWTQYGRCRHLDLLSLVPERMPLVARCRDGGRHWDRIRETDLYRAVEGQILRRGPLVEWIESASGRTWDDLTAPLASKVFSEARLRGLFGTDVVAAADPPGGGRGEARAFLLTRIGFLEYLAYPWVRRAAEGRLAETLAAERYRGLDLYRATFKAGPARAGPAGTSSAAFAVKGDILAVATDLDLLREVLDRTFRDWSPADDLPPWSLPGPVPFAAGADLHRLPGETAPAPPPEPGRPRPGPWAPAPAPASGWRAAFRMFPVQEALLPLDPDALGRCTLALDVRAVQVCVNAAVGLRPGAAPRAPIGPPAGGARTALAALPENTVAFVTHRVPFRDFWSFFERTSLDAGREVAAAEMIGNAWKFFQNQARDVEIPALRRNGLEEGMLPHLRGGPTFALTRETPSRTAGGDAVPPQTLVALIETTGTGDGAEAALHDLLQRRIQPILAQIPNDVTETLLPAGRGTVRFLQRKSWPVQAAYGETRGVFALGIRPEAVVRVVETLQGQQRGAIRSARFRAVAQSLGWPAEAGAAAEGAEAADAPIPPDLLTLAYADLRRLCALVREVAPDLARFAKDQINGPQLRQSLKGRNPRQPAEAPEAYERRISGLYDQEVQGVVDGARRRLELPLGLLDLFTAGGVAVTTTKEGYALRGVLLMQ